MVTNYQSIKQAFEGEEWKKPFAEKRSFELFQFCAGQLLLGEKSLPGSDTIDQRIESYARTERLNIDLMEMTFLAAIKELAGESGDKAAEKGLSFLQADREVDLEQFQIVESALALSALIDRQTLRSKFFEAGLNLTDNDRSLTFELLFLIAAQKNNDATLDRLASATVRSIRNSIWLPPFYSAAPHVCALAARSRKKDVRLHSLLRGRLKSMDQEFFDENGEPRLKFGKLSYRLDDTDEQGTRLIVRRSVNGNGVLDAGIYEMEDFTSHLYETISAAADKAETGHAKQKRSLASLVERALQKRNGKFLTVLDLSPKVKTTDVDRELLEERFELGWEIARRKITDLKAAKALEIK